MRAITAVSLAAFVACAGNRPPAEHVTASDPRVAAVERALVPAFLIRGAPIDDLSLPARMAHYHVPAVSVAVVDHGALVWAKAYGVSEVGGAPATTETLFQAGSISKPVAAMVALRLVETGVLALDDDVDRKLRSWHIPASELRKATPITLRRLLSHTAGLNVHGFPGYAVGTPVPTVVQVLDGAPPANTAAIHVEVQPGTEHRYSGGGYTVMQQLVIDATGRPFPEVADALVLAPLGMTHSGYLEPLPADRASRAATGTYKSGQRVAGRWHVYPELAAAGLWTTPSDLARVIIELQTGHRVLSAPTTATMLTPVMQDYGLGLRIAGTGEGRRFEHGGDDAGFQAFLVGSVAGGRGAVVMTNSENGGTIAREIVRAIAREYAWPGYPQGEIREVIAVAPDHLARYEGVFDGGNLSLGIARKDARLEAFSVGDPGDRVTLFPTSETAFFAIDEPFELEFVFDHDAVTGMRIGKGPGAIELRRRR